MTIRQRPSRPRSANPTEPSHAVPILLHRVPHEFLKVSSRLMVQQFLNPRLDDNSSDLPTRCDKLLEQVILRHLPETLPPATAWLTSTMGLAPAPANCVPSTPRGFVVQVAFV